MGRIELVSRLAEMGDQLSAAVRDGCPDYVRDDVEDLRPDPISLSWAEALTLAGRVSVVLARLKGLLTAKQTQQELRRRSLSGFTLRPAVPAAGGEVLGAEHVGQGREAADGES